MSGTIFRYSNCMLATLNARLALPGRTFRGSGEWEWAHRARTLIEIEERVASLTGSLGAARPLSSQSSESGDKEKANGPLSTENVFEYFTTSMFYDKQSNNQVLRMQTIHTGMPLVNEAEELKRFTGVEFAVVHAQPPSLFIIHKRERMSPEEVKPLAAYFIMNNRIYQSPDIYTVLSNRLLTSLNSIQTSLETLRRHRPDYTPRTGFVWPIVDPTLSTDANKKQEDANVIDEQEAPSTTETKTSGTSSSSKKLQNNMLLMNAMRTTAAHSKGALSSSVLARSAESLPPEPSAGMTANRSSVTPAPISVAPTPKNVAQEPGTKTSSGQTKKKRKRK
ncbi:Mediator of RNA polymerase II transcription subunit 6 [Marasmius tenuissimus]|uniref:Mediator of RNA polymerase II transcription subunit 6 n=1 Tax=Marasmius tenuissimus TaxID=585030 RepID=A0ABR3ACK4_9AGAR